MFSYENATASTSTVQQQMTGSTLVHANSDLNIANGGGSVGSAPDETSLGRASRSSRPPMVHQGSSSGGRSGFPGLKTHSGSTGKYMGDVEDDVHVGVSCLRALMNNKFGLKEVMECLNGEAIYCIVRAILHHSLRTKSLAIDLLSAICIIQDGHELILRAFNRFQMVRRGGGGCSLGPRID